MTESKQSTTSNSSTAPWGPQADALQGAFTNAQGAYNKASDATAPTNFTAGFTPDQLNTFHSMLNYGNGTMGAANGVTNAGTGMIGTGSSAISDALGKMGGFDPSATNNPAAIAAGAKTYANGLDINGAVKNAMLNATQTARDVTLPGMESSAAGSGNINSSRTGLAEGLVQRGLAQQAAGLTADMTNNAYNTGAGIAANSAATNNAQSLTNNTATGALGSNAFSGGVGGVGAGIGDTGNLFSLAAMGGAGEKDANQADLTNQLQQYQAKVSSPYDALNGLMNIIGSHPWGSTSNGTSTTKNNPSMLQTVGGIMSMF